MSRNPCERLADIRARIVAARSAEQRLADAEAQGDADLVEIAFDAILYDLLVIGEAIKALPEEWMASHPDVSWSDASKMRDLLAHHYFRVRSDVVRATVDLPLTVLGSACESLATRHCPGTADRSAS